MLFRNELVYLAYNDLKRTYELSLHFGFFSFWSHHSQKHKKKHCFFCDFSTCLKFVCENCILPDHFCGSRWRCVWPRMFSKIKKQLDAAQRFLCGLKSLASFDSRVSEYASLLRQQIEQSENWSTAEGSEVLALIDDSLWGSEAVNLRELIASRCVLQDGEKSKAGKERRALQDFLNLPLYLTHELWLKLLGGNISLENKLEILFKHSGALGLRCPTEQTCALLLAMCHNLPSEQLLESEKLKLLQDNRHRIKKSLQLPAPVVYLDKLPQNPRDLPVAVTTLVFAQQPRVDPPQRWEELVAAARAWPLRKTNAASNVSRQKPAGDGTQAMMMLGNFFQHFTPRPHGCSNSAENCHPAQPALARGPLVLAIQDKQDEPETCEVTITAAASA